jgi:hypothetical protein
MLISTRHSDLVLLQSLIGRISREALQERKMGAMAPRKLGGIVSGGQAKEESGI